MGEEEEAILRRIELNERVKVCRIIIKCCYGSLETLNYTFFSHTCVLYNYQVLENWTPTKCHSQAARKEFVNYCEANLLK